MLCPRCGDPTWNDRERSCPHCGFIQLSAPLPEPSTYPGALQSGQLLRNGRYGLQERVAQRRWLSGIDETSWIGRDFQYHGEEVMLCEIMLPDPRSSAIQATLRDTTHALVSAGNHPAIPFLQDVFGDQGRIFFVFASVKAESLHVRLRRLRRPLSEQEALEMCQDISTILGVLARQSPPLVHGCICPEHLYCSADMPRFLLGNFSPLIAGGDLRFLQGRADGWSSPYHAPEVHLGVLDRRSDIYSLLATVYYAVTGTVSPASGGFFPARHLNPALSVGFDAILAKGLHPAPHQRYQHPFELQQDILALASRAVVQRQAQQLIPKDSIDGSFGSASMPASDTAYPFPIKPEFQEDATLLPSAETLPQMSEGNDRFEAIVLLIVVLLSFGVVTALSSFHL